MAEVATHTQSARPAHRPDVDRYRPDIDGLRGVAVAMVVLWHAGAEFLPGGYAGVDVFFVISGYVITGSLQRGSGAGGISVLGFYARRLRRIAPAFLVMLAVVLAAGFVIQLPVELTRTARVALGGLALVANVVLWGDGGYWTHSANTEPLRHIWSLSIEEQFYLVYPALLGLLLARAPKAAGAVLAALAALSFALFLYLIGRSPAAAFELGPARAWELMIGCVCALQAATWRPPPIVDQALTLAGAALVAAALLRLARGEPAILASFGAALLVLGGASRPLVSRALAAVPLVVVGLASYSLYLWHWPLLALARSLNPTGIGPLETAALLAATVALGFASWRFIEQPLRRPWPDARARRRFIAICGALGLFSVSASALALAGGGWPGRFPPRVAAIAAFEGYARTPAWRAQFRPACFAQRPSLEDYDAAGCFTAAPGQPNVLLWGDSHAAELAGSLAGATARLGAHLMQATMPACAPGYGPVRRARGCERFNQLVRERLRTQRADVVVISFSAFSEGRGLLDQVGMLTRGGARVIVAGPTPQYTTDVAPLLARAWPKAPIPPVEALPFAADAALKAATAARPGVSYVSGIDLFCPDRQCALAAPDGAPLIWDRSHLTPAGARLVVARLAGPLAEALRAPPLPPAAPAPAPRSAPQPSTTSQSERTLRRSQP